MTMAELETSVREGARPVVVVLDNGGYGTIRMHQDRDGRPHTATDLGPIDFAAVAEASGALGFRVPGRRGVRGAPCAMPWRHVGRRSSIACSTRPGCPSTSIPEAARVRLTAPGSA